MAGFELIPEGCVIERPVFILIDTPRIKLIDGERDRVDYRDTEGEPVGSTYGP
jgi:hypothetical protein